VYNGKIYYIGGAKGQDASTITQKTVEVYDPNTNSWTIVADMPIGLDHISSAVTVIGNRIIVVGGESSHSSRSKRVLAYSPASNTWEDLTELPVTKSAGIAIFHNGNIFYSGGNFSKSTYKGNPEIQQSQQITVNISPIADAYVRD